MVNMTRVSHEHIGSLFANEIIPMRAAIIPVTRDQLGNSLWLMGTTYNGQLSDFGGGCHVRDKETPIAGALREFREEVGISDPPALPQISTDSTVPIVVKGISRIYQEIVRNIIDPSKTMIYEAPARNNPSIRRYFFHVYVNVPLSDISDFTSTFEMKAIGWYSPRAVLSTSYQKINGSCLVWIRYMKSCEGRSYNRSVDPSYRGAFRPTRLFRSRSQG